MTFLSTGASILTVALTALLMNSRQVFYAISYVDDFKKMGKRKLLSIHYLTDESYAVGNTLISYKWKHSTFLSILLGTACYMVLLRV